MGPRVSGGFVFWSLRERWVVGLRRKNCGRGWETDELGSFPDFLLRPLSREGEREQGGRWVAAVDLWDTGPE